MRGYFGVGAEGISKPMNLGAILRTAHAFGASFAFTVDAHHRVRDVYQADTAKSVEHVPYYPWDGLDDMHLPDKCQLVGIELTDEAIDLPTFRHPLCAAYVFGRGARLPDRRDAGQVQPHREDPDQVLRQCLGRLCHYAL